MDTKTKVQIRERDQIVILPKEADQMQMLHMEAKIMQMQELKSLVIGCFTLNEHDSLMNRKTQVSPLFVHSLITKCAPTLEAIILHDAYSLPAVKYPKLKLLRCRRLPTAVAFFAPSLISFECGNISIESLIWSPSTAGVSR